MKGDMPVQNITLLADANCSAKRYYAVKVAADGQFEVAGAGDNAIGILQNTPEAGQAGQIMCLGVSYAVYGGIVTAGQNLKADAAGKLVTAGGTDAVVAVALESGVENDIHPVVLVTRTACGVAGISAGYTTLAFPVTLSEMDNVAIVTNYVPGFAGQIVKTAYVANVPTTDAADSNFTITPSVVGVGNVTGGVVTLDVGAAGTDPDTKGKVINGTAITATNTFTNVQGITLTVNNTSNAFADGTGTVLVTLKVTA